MLRTVPVLLCLSTSLANSQVQQIEIKGSLDARRSDTAGSISVTRDDLTRHGDTTVSAALRRQPGISVQNGELRMRGLGAGYTVILLNGEPTPPGFSIDSISPALIDRIEIVRSGSAELGTQGIAGTINVIMRKAAGKRQASLMLAANLAPSHVAPSASLRLGDKRGALAWSLGASVDRTNPRQRDLTVELVEGEQPAQRDFRDHSGGSITRAELAPRMTWTFDDGDSLSWNSLLDRSTGRFAGVSTETTRSGAPTTYPDSSFSSRSDTYGQRSDIAWTRRTGEHGTLIVKAGIDRSTRETDYLFQGEGVQESLARSVVSNAIDHVATFSGKYLAPLGAGHNLGLGWDGARINRGERRLQRDSTFGGADLGTVDEDYDAQVTRLATFIQDEWAFTPRLQAYLGLRWEGLRTRTEGRLLAPVSNRSSVFSPIAQLLWKLPGTERDQLRMSLSRTYKAPATRLLVPRRYTINNNNNGANADMRGNPNLLPELASAVDGGYEHYYARGGMVALSAYARRINRVTVQTLSLESGARIATPLNAGKAKAWGLELDAKMPLGAQVDLRANAARNWSRVEAVPGPDNRLGDQVAATINAGVDYKPAANCTLGVNVNLQYGGPVRYSQDLRGYTGPVRTLDVFGSWKIDGATQLRLSATNLLHRDQISARSYADATSSIQRRTVSERQAQLRLILERQL